MIESGAVRALVERVELGGRVTCYEASRAVSALVRAAKDAEPLDRVSSLARDAPDAMRALAQVAMLNSNVDAVKALHALVQFVNAEKLVPVETVRGALASEVAVSRWVDLATSSNPTAARESRRLLEAMAARGVDEAVRAVAVAVVEGRAAAEKG